MQLVVDVLQAEELCRMAEIVRAIGVRGGKIGARATFMGREKTERDCRGVSQEKRKAKRIGLVHMWLPDGDDYDAAAKVHEEECTYPELPFADVNRDNASWTRK